MDEQYQQIRQARSASQPQAAFREIQTADPSAGLLRPRDRRLGRAVKLLDVLSAGDEALRTYLEENQPAAAQAVADAQADMELAETPEEAKDFRPDPIDELIAVPVPQMSTPDMAALRAALMAQCQDTIRSLALPKTSERTGSEDGFRADLVSGTADSMMKMSVRREPSVLLAKCSIIGCCIHSVTLKGGDILHHYKHSELATPALRLADRLLNGPNEPDYVEVYGDNEVVAVDSSGCPKVYRE